MNETSAGSGRRLKRFLPTYAVGRAADIDWDDVGALGVATVYVDFDNTLSAHGGEHFDMEARAVIDAVRAAGLVPVLFSNARAGRRQALLGDLDLDVVESARKPNPRALLADLAARGRKTAEAIVVGDQLLTDIAAANRAGIRSIRVSPLSSAEPFYIRLKRWLEAVIVFCLKREFAALGPPPPAGRRHDTGRRDDDGR